jgi:hypothetical protein
MSQRFLFVLIGLLLAPAAPAADVTNPEAVENLRFDRSEDDVLLTWDPVTTDAAGNTEVVDHYEVYRGIDPDFVPDKAGGSNRIGTSLTESFSDLGAAGDPEPLYFYLVSAVDADGNQGSTRPVWLDSPPVLSGYWTDTTIELDWTDAQPLGGVTSHWGESPRTRSTAGVPPVSGRPSRTSGCRRSIPPPVWNPTSTGTSR